MGADPVESGGALDEISVPPRDDPRGNEAAGAAESSASASAESSPGAATEPAAGASAESSAGAAAESSASTAAESSARAAAASSARAAAESSAQSASRAARTAVYGDELSSAAGSKKRETRHHRSPSTVTRHPSILP